MARLLRLLVLFGLVAVALLVSTVPAFAPCHIITFSNDPYTVKEDDGKVTITVSNNGGQGTPSVDYETQDDSAKSPSDFTAKSGTIQFIQGESESSIQVSIKDDKADEPNEMFLVKLSNAGGACVPPPGIQEDTATVTIQDNDEKQIVQPTVSPTPTVTKKPKPKPSTASASPSPTPTPTVVENTGSPIAAPASGGGGISGGAVAGIIGATVVLGSAAAFWVRRRFLT